MKNDLKVFSNELFGELRIVTINEDVYFIGKDVAEALGYTDTNRAVKQHVDKEDLKVCSRKGYGDLYPTLWDNENDFANKILINESGMYSLIFGSKLQSAKAFKRWVTSEVLPELRKSGVYITESATDEAIDFNRVYGKRRVRKSIRETQDVRKLFEDYIKLSAVERSAKRIDNKDRINTLNIFADELENKLANEAVNMRGSELLATQELLTDIHKEKNRLSNKLNGGKKSHLTKQIAHLKEELNMTTSDYYEIPHHGFSVNYQYSFDERTKKVCKSRAYQTWINKLNLNECLPVELPNVSLEEPLRISLCYVCKESFDVENMNKSILDEVANYYNFNDNIISEVRSKRIETCDEYYEGKIYIKIENMDDTDEY